MKLTWKGVLAVDGGAIDQDHKELFNLYNSYAGRPESAVDKKQMLKDFSQAATTHFFLEHAYLQANGFGEDQIQRHSEKRRQFADKLASLSGSGVAEILVCFQECLRWHVLNENRPIRLFEKSK